MQPESEQVGIGIIQEPYIYSSNSWSCVIDGGNSVTTKQIDRMKNSMILF